MERKILQQRIDGCSGAAEMIEIALAYLDGAVLRDAVAAEAWLNRAIETEEPIHSARAMGILVTRVMGREQVYSDEEYLELRRRAEAAVESEKAELDALLSFATEKQKKL